MEIIFGLGLCAVIGGLIGSAAGRGGTGFFLGLFLGPIGWIIVLLLPRDLPRAAAPAAPSQVDRLAALEKLADLRDRKVITAEEFEAQKAELLRHGIPQPANQISAGVRALVTDGDKIAAIRLHREETGLSLADAKDAVERAATLVPVAPVKRTSPREWALAALLFALIFGGALWFSL